MNKGTIQRQAQSETGETRSLRQSLKRVLVLQCITTLVLLTVVAVLLAASVDGEEKLSVVWPKLLACLYGATLALTGTILSARSVMRGQHDRSGRSMMISVYAGLLNKLVIVGGGIAFGLVFLGLEPVYVIIGYIVVQMASVGVMIGRKPEAGET